MARYLFSVGVIAALIVGSAGVFNYVVDPFLLYHHRDGTDDLLTRVDQFDNMRLYKPYHVNRLKPEAIIIGTSRAGTTRPQHSSWDDLRTYNLAMPGMTVYELNRLVKHAQAVQPLSRLLIGLDYNTILRPLPEFRPGFEPDRLAQSPADFHSVSFIGQWLQDQQSFLFSVDMLRESVSALDPPPKMPRAYYLDGAWKGIGKALIGRGGYIFVAKGMLESRIAPHLRPDDNMVYLEELLRFCYSNNIDTKLFLTPTHVFFVDLWLRIASKALWYDTHREILSINERLAVEYGRAPFAIWGFGDERQVVAEPIYKGRDVDRAWFTDGAHYGMRLAARIMDALLGSSSGFGQKLTTDSIDDYLDRIDSIRWSFFESNADQMAVLHSKIGQVPALEE